MAGSWHGKAIPSRKAEYQVSILRFNGQTEQKSGHLLLLCIEIEHAIHYNVESMLLLMEDECYTLRKNIDLQNSYWEGFTQANQVTNLFVWDFSSEIT